MNFWLTGLTTKPAMGKRLTTFKRQKNPCSNKQQSLTSGRVLDLRRTHARALLLSFTNKSCIQRKGSSRGLDGWMRVGIVCVLCVCVFVFCCVSVLLVCCSDGGRRHGAPLCALPFLTRFSPSRQAPYFILELTPFFFLFFFCFFFFFSGFRSFIPCFSFNTGL